MIFLFLITYAFAENKFFNSVQMLYTQQQNQMAYNAVIECLNSIQNKTLSKGCWSFLNSKPDTKNKMKIRIFFKKKCGYFKYSYEQMKQINCSQQQIQNQKIKEYKQNDIALIDN